MKGGYAMAKNRIAMLRKEQGMNQRELGERLGVGQTTVSAWETGKNEPDNDSMNTMAQMFGVSIGYLAGYENDEITRGLTQEQIRARYEEKEREKEIAAYLKAEERERQGFSDEEIEEYYDSTYEERAKQIFLCSYSSYEEEIYEFFDFLAMSCISDLHHMNIGFINGAPVIIDYAGYDE